MSYSKQDRTAKSDDASKVRDEESKRQHVSLEAAGVDVLSHQPDATSDDAWLSDMTPGSTLNRGTDALARPSSITQATSRTVSHTARPTFGGRSFAGIRTHSARQPVVQPRLMVGAADDSYEREADHVADRVISMRAPVSSPATTRQTRERSARKHTLKQNKAVIQRAEITVPQHPADMDETKVEWTAGGAYDSVVLTDISALQGNQTHIPSLQFLTDEQKSLLVKVKIAKIEMDPTVNRVMMYPMDPNHGIWVVARGAGDPPVYWKCISNITTKQVGFFQKQTVLDIKGKKFLEGISTLTSAQDIAARVYDNMLKSGISYETAGGTPEGIVNGEKQGQCHAINGALGILIQAGLASRGVNAVVKKGDTGDHPFVTNPAGYGKSTIKGGTTNIVRYKQVDGKYRSYNQKSIKFDNHSWVKVNGTVYDLVAGIRGGANSCVYTAITATGKPDEYSLNGHILAKCTAKVKAPWTSAYEIRL